MHNSLQVLFEGKTHQICIPFLCLFISLHRTAELQQPQDSSLTLSLLAELSLVWDFVLFFQLIKVNFEHLCLLYKEMQDFLWFFFFSYQQTGPSSHLRDIARIGPAFVVTPGLCGFYRAQLIIFFLMEVLNFSEKKELGRREQMEASLLHDSFFLHQSFKLWQTEKQRHCTLY